MTNDLFLGAWEEDRDALQRSAVSDKGDVSDLPDLVQFQVYVARLINRRELSASAEYDLPAAFVLVSAEEYTSRKAGGTEERLLHTGKRRLTGRIHFVTKAVTSSIVEEYGSDDAALFLRLGEIHSAHNPTLIYVPEKTKSTLSYYPNGTVTDCAVSDLPLAANSVDAQAIVGAIHAVHAQELVTPDNGGPVKLWKDASKGVPIEQAERTIQQLVRVGLATKFAPFSIRSEQPAKVGRTDLEIVDDRTQTLGKVTHHAVLEMKVLRSRGESGTSYSETAIQEHIQEGVEQANAYGIDKNTQTKLLCCFDMRDKDSGSEQTFLHISDAAKKLKVHLQSWFLYRSSEDYRAAIAAHAVTRASLTPKDSPLA